MKGTNINCCMISLEQVLSCGEVKEFSSDFYLFIFFLKGPSLCNLLISCGIDELHPSFLDLMNLLHEESMIISGLLSALFKGLLLEIDKS